MNVKALLYSSVLLLIACTDQQDPAHKQYSIEEFYDNISISGGAFSADESKLLISSNESGIYNVYSLDIASTERTMLTSSTQESYHGESYFPNDDRFIYTFDAGGNENYQIYLMNTDGTSKNITQSDNARNIFWGWSQDEKSLFFSANARNPRFMDIYEIELTFFFFYFTYKKLIYTNNDGLNVVAISPDKRYFALTETISNANGKMYLFDRETGDKKDISVHEGDAQYSPQFFSLDNKNLYYTTDENSDFVYLAKVDLSTGDVEKVYAYDWDILYAYNSKNEKYRIVGINEDAKTRMRIFDLENDTEVELPNIENGSISSVSISNSETLARLTVSTSASPNNIYVFNFETKELRKITNTLNPQIDPDDLVNGKVVRYKSFDGLEIPAIYYQPKIATPSDQVPGLVFVHGGPGGQSRLSYFPLIQFLANNGYAILAVNNRGSGGYGKIFNHLDDRNHGDKDLKDCIAGKDFLKSTGVIDMERVGIIGGSYGGFMTMAALTTAPEEFAVGVNIFGVTNWLRTLKSMPPHWESFKKALYDEMGDPYSADSVRLYNISPVFHAQNITKPLMVLQGANDIRVLQVESDEIVAGARANQVPVEYLVFDDEGHGFRKKENEIKGYGSVKTFLDQYLKGN